MLTISANLAKAAFTCVSFDPEKRGQQFVSNFEEVNRQITRLCLQYGVSADRFLVKHYQLATAYLASQSRCASAAVVGFSKFPIARMEKRSNYALNHLNRLAYFRENIEKTLMKITRSLETEDDKKARWIKRVEDLKAHQELMKRANSLLRKKDIPALISLVGQEKAGQLQKPDFCGRIGFSDFKLRNNLANIKRLEAQIRQIDTARKNKAQNGFNFDGCKVEFDPDEIRYNIIFNVKPGEETRSKLKSHGFKWSPRRGAWTRGAKTINIQTIKNILGEKQ